MDELLKHYRDGIDTLDREIVYLLSRRFDYVKEIGKIKKNSGVINPIDENRWNRVLENIKKEAKDKGLSEEFIENIWNEIHREALNLENKIKNSNI
nr:chorismate mutase [Candidatus Gracilibacteria bacterium]